MIKKMHIALTVGLILIWVAHQPGRVDGQSLRSPFAYLCRNTCGGYGMFRRMCCSHDELCCEKPDECPADPMQDTMFPVCMKCEQDIDCIWSSKCCESNGQKCCTPSRLSFFNRNSSKRAKEKVVEINSTSETSTAKSSAITDEEEIIK